VSQSPPGTAVPQSDATVYLGQGSAGTAGTGDQFYYDDVSLALGIPPALDHFAVAPSTTGIAAGATFDVRVTAVDSNNNPVPSYTGTIGFSSSDPGAVLPADYSYTASDAGTHVFSVTLVTAGSQTLTVEDTSHTTIAGVSPITVSLIDDC
jgi:hypothetical protein